jgi:hypothetical protein
MNATSFALGLLIVLFTMLLLHRMRKLKPQIAAYGSQRMCPSLRTDHISIKGTLLGWWQACDGGGGFDFKEMNHCLRTNCFSRRTEGAHKL